MGATKHEIYRKDVVKMAELLKAIAHPARLKAVLLIANSTDEDLTAKDIQKEIPLSQSTIAQHLKQLRDSGLVETQLRTIDKVNHLCYRINLQALNQIKKLIELLIKKSTIKQDDNVETLRNFYSKLQAITNWNQSFES
ncbi:MAG: winged helix-turn-helix transcriptional regulator [Crocinitomicaceae bacterium]|nr:winged helix-turn-helix transcriptional regulator [Crocinitomicaceae bacterium]NGF77331.1 winged helix-turn-helix transcriptional regulator [Fluviicola sp. SGL-29]